MKKKILFVCLSGVNRSRTLADYVNHSHNKQYEARYGGIQKSIFYGKTISGDVVKWADKIYVMEQQQAKFIKEHYPDDYKKVTILHIPDVYDYGDITIVKKARQFIPWL